MLMKFLVHRFIKNNNELLSVGRNLYHSLKYYLFNM